MISGRGALDATSAVLILLAVGALTGGRGKNMGFGAPHTPGPALLAAFRAVTAFANGFAQVEFASAVAGGERGGLVDQVLALPPGRYPRLVGAATTTSNPVAEFRAGLDIVITGLDRTAEP
ncbi:MAG TPA: hypothetical protein VKZ81_21050 [Pseudonocardia sp.]|uniref:hypothetical protein n=1 Tax=Pseudonocardia sp. TaxID=60912 RepID=UPI002B4ADEE6|nr:hypothetical protein [Pseudonocardia sp.]HLU57955.1 hypothetical protein [Pseudonocardia sp.]